MIHKITDSIIVLIIVLISFVGVNQACNHNGGPGNPLLDNTPVLVMRCLGSTEGPTPLTVELDGSNSSSPDGGPLTFSWQFSDGEISDEPSVQHTFTSSGRHSVILAITNRMGTTSYSDPIIFYAYGLANSPWPKFAHDEHNSGISENPGPMMDMENADSGGAFPRYWRGGIQNDTVTSVCIGYDGMVVYTQGEWLRARTPYGGVLWDIEYESKITAWPAILHDGSIVAGTDQGWVYRINPDGTNIWSTYASRIINEDVILDSAVNVGHDGTIYIGGYLRESTYTGQPSGRLLALTLDGEIRWMKETLTYDQRLVPVIGIDQNIILNGPECNIYTPEGLHINSFSIESESGNIFYLNPACVTPDGSIIFNHIRLPMFSSSGEFLRFLVDSDKLYDEGVKGTPGVNQTPIVDSSTANLVWEANYYGATLVSSLNFDDISWITSPPAYYDLPKIRGGFTPAGAAEDSHGRIYVAYQGIRAFSPLEDNPARRHSIWAYSRPAPKMSAPVIGEDGWLYAGCGDDLLAIGD